MAAPVLNRIVPDFKCTATGAQPIHMKSLRGKNIVIYFHPKDSIASHERIRAKHGLPFDLLLDPGETICKKFAVIREKSLYGRKFSGVVRSTFLIDEHGKRKQEWRKVKEKGHATKVLEATKELLRVIAFRFNNLC